MPGAIETVLENDAPEEYYRNRFLCDAMVGLKMVDTIGSGIRKMYNYQRKRLFPMPFYQLGDNRVTVTITGKIIDINYASVLVRNPDLSLRDIELLNRIQMKTSYQDFFKYYLEQPSIDADIQAMKTDIDKHKYETWADLEIGMGIYSSQCANKDIFLKCLADIKTNLKEYLQKESEKIKDYKLKSFPGFMDPSRFLDPEPRDIYEQYRRRMTSGMDINVITLNYTPTLESLFNFKGNLISLSPTVVLRSIQHVHGTLDEMMVMGVNDSNQIANTTLNTDRDVKEDFIKPEYNDACLNNKNKVCESLIRNAEMIVFYGTSLGLSDDKWWKFIGKRMAQDNYPLLVYLPYDAKKDQSVFPNRLRRWTLDCIHELREKFDINLDEEMLASRMCVAFNKSLFSVVKSDQKPQGRGVIDGESVTSL